MDPVCRQKGRRDRVRAAWGMCCLELRPKKLPRVSKIVRPAREYNLNESLLVLLPGRLRGFEQSRVFLYGFFEQRCLLARQLPILLLHGFREPRKFQVRIGVSRKIEKMMEPRP